jgi:hypothetical protein
MIVPDLLGKVQKPINGFLDPSRSLPVAKMNQEYQCTRQSPGAKNQKKGGVPHGN